MDSMECSCDVWNADVDAMEAMEGEGIGCVVLGIGVWHGNQVGRR